MFYLFLLLIGLAAVATYAAFMLRLVPGLAEQRFGVLEDLPPDLGTWKTDETSTFAGRAASEGLVRQVRVYLRPARSWFGRDQLVRQVRYRSRATHEIVRTDPEETLKRRRIRP
jgi:hypothetical protein